MWVQEGFSESRYSCSSRLSVSCSPVHLQGSPEGKSSETSSYLGIMGNMTITASLRKALTDPVPRRQSCRSLWGGDGNTIILYEKPGISLAAWYGYMRPATAYRPFFFPHADARSARPPPTGLCPTKTAGHSAAEA